MPMNPRLLRPTTTGFDPRRIADLSAWFDAQDLSTLTFNSGNVSEWRSKAGGWTANQGVALNQPGFVTDFLSSKNAIRYSASGQNLPLTAKWADLGDNSTKQITEFYVYQADGNVSGALINEAGTGSGHQLFPYFSTAAFYDPGPASTTRVSASVGASVTTGDIYTGLRNDALVRLRFGRAQVGTRSNASGNLYASAAAFAVFVANANTSIAEAVLYRRALSDLEIDAVEKYLANKYGL